MSNKADYGKLLKIVGPVSFQYLMTSLVSASDAFMLGFLDQRSLSAVSLATQVAFVYSLFFGAFVFGFNVMGAQYYGKKDIASVEKIITIALRYTMIVGFIFSLVTFIIPDKVMYIFTSDQELIAEGAKYLRAVSASYLLTGISQVYFGVLKVCDRAGLSSFIGSMAVVVNIILNAVLIFGIGSFEGMEITGAALATVFARVFEVVFALAATARFKCPKSGVKYLLKRDDEVLHKDYWKYTTPLLINQLGWGGGVTMYSVIMGHLGSDAVAANSIAGIVRSMVASLCWGIAAAVGIVIGQMLGSGKLDEAKRLGGKYVRLSIWIGVGSGIVILCLIPPVLKVITLTPVAQRYLKWMLVMAAYYIIGNSLNSTIIAGIFPAGGDTKFGMVCDVVTLWCVVVPLGLLFAFVIKAPVLVVAFILTLDEFVKIPAVYRHYMKYNWVKNITRS
ncbi:MAG: MATE family efflux transporter [Lachnospiraceae bacterium]|nr:MATE family efflux transporter [Lachnospiraceae bacterium]